MHPASAPVVEAIGSEVAFALAEWVSGLRSCSANAQHLRLGGKAALLPLATPALSQHQGTSTT